MNAQQLRIYAVADIHSPDSFRMAQLSPESCDLVLTLGDIDEGTLDYYRVYDAMAFLGWACSETTTRRMKSGSRAARTLRRVPGITIGRLRGRTLLQEECPEPLHGAAGLQIPAEDSGSRLVRFPRTSTERGFERRSGHGHGLYSSRLV